MFSNVKAGVVYSRVRSVGRKSDVLIVLSTGSDVAGSRVVGRIVGVGPSPHR